MSHQPTDSEPQLLIERHVAQWNEPDPEVRRRLIRQVWAVDGVQALVNPPQEVRKSTAYHAIASPPLEVHGHDALDARVRTDHQFVA